MAKGMAIKVGLIEQAMGLLKRGDALGAEKLCRVVLRGNPRDAWAIHALGLVAHQTGRQEEAVAQLREAARLAPGQPEFLNNLGAILGRIGRVDEAAVVLEKAVALRPEDAAGQINLAMALERAGKSARAHTAAVRAVELAPQWPEAHAALGAALRGLGRIDAAQESYETAIRLRPEFAEAVVGLATVCEKRGDYSGAIAAYRRAVALRPDDAVMRSNLLYTLFYDPTISAESLRAEHAEWARRHEVPLRASIGSHGNDRNIGRRIRIGYVSGDFRRHSVARFLEPLIAGRNRDHFEAIAYSDVAMPDEVTARIRAACDGWRETLGMNDADLAALIRRDRIDILIDPTGHMGGNRLLVFARKPAPIQIAFPGYPGSCGLAAMDYFVTDSHQHSAGAAVAEHFTETLLRVDPSSRCYQMDEDGPVPNALPADTAGHVTFGSLNRPLKVTHEMVDIWADILLRVPGSRLLFLAGDHAVEGARQHLLWFAENGIEGDRIEVVTSRPRAEYLRQFHRVDVALDTFPYAGCTTTCDALWMGVPTVSMVGRSYVSRVGLGVLSQVELEDLAVGGAVEYVEMACRLTADLPRLRDLRHSLRERCQRSALMDGSIMVRAWEEAVRGVWGTWCGQTAGVAV